MNGGNTLYIYKDGFGDIYNATPAEEAVWSLEIIENALKKLDTETNSTSLRFAVNDLVFHKYSDVDQLLFEKMQEAVPARKIVFASLLWKMKGYEKSFAIIYQLFLSHREKYLNEIFEALQDFKDNTAARNFILDCISGVDLELYAKACITLTVWAYTGMSELRVPGLLDHLKDRNSAEFPHALAELKQLLLL